MGKEPFNAFLGRRFLVRLVSNRRPDLIKNPRIADGGAPDHNRIAPRRLDHPAVTIRVHNITVSDDGNIDRVFHRFDKRPVRFPHEPLRLCARMDGDQRHSGILDRPGDFRNTPRGGFIPPGADLGRYGHRAFFDNAPANLAEQAQVLEHRRTAVLADDLPNGAAKIEVDKPWA